MLNQLYEKRAGGAGGPPGMVQMGKGMMLPPDAMALLQQLSVPGLPPGVLPFPLMQSLLPANGGGIGMPIPAGCLPLPLVPPPQLPPPLVQPGAPPVPAPGSAGVQPQQPKRAKDCIRLRGLPADTAVTDILCFLGEHSSNIVIQGVHLVYSENVRPPAACASCFPFISLPLMTCLLTE